MTSWDHYLLIMVSRFLLRKNTALNPNFPKINIDSRLCVITIRLKDELGNFLTLSRTPYRLVVKVNHFKAHKSYFGSYNVLNVVVCSSYVSGSISAVSAVKPVKPSHPVPICRLKPSSVAIKILGRETIPWPYVLYVVELEFCRS